MRYSMLFFLLFLPSAVIAQDFDAVEIESTRLTDSIYMMTGEGGNMALFIGEDVTFLIDDQFAPLTAKIKAAVAQWTDRPVEYIVNTHWHFDHTDGNENFGGEGALIISHENSRRRMSEDQLVALFDRPQPAYSADGLPKITFTESLTLHLNGETIEIFHRGNAHTDGDAVIHFLESNIIHTGDVFVRYGFPFIDEPKGGSIDGMIETAAYIAGLSDDETQIIPGHGALSTRADVIAYKEMLETIRDRVRALMEEGKTLEEIALSDPTSGFEPQGVETESFIKIVYDSLKKRGNSGN
jgi:glyoxylase-like metal-dependent hydrolase (beta-lactamase superfamily II)